MAPSILKKIAAALLTGLFAAAGAQASTLEISVSDAGGTALNQVVATLEPLDRSGPPRGTSLPHAVMDQRNLAFLPQLLLVQAGTTVDFPNSDNVRHQVYSFSAAKRFELKLYSGEHRSSVLFDKPGVVTMGCNIHDWMLGYIDVVDTPWFARSDARGRIVLTDVPPGRYTVNLWHPRLKPGGPPRSENIILADAPLHLTYRLDVRAAETSNQVPAGLETGLGDRIRPHAD